MVTVDVEPTAAPVAGQAEQGAALEGLLGPTLDELEAVRAETAREIMARALIRVPAGLAAGLALSLWLPESDGFDFAVFVLGGGLAGYSWAAYKLSEAYRRLYKDRVLPALAARFGALRYRKPERLDAAKLRRHGLFEAFDRLTAEDEIHGERHGLSVSMVELRLTRREGKHERTVFDGLLAEVALPRNLSGVTAVIADGGVFGGLRNLVRRGANDRVRLEDPVFEQRYEVYGSDQIAARALLTPAFMERLLALGDRAHFDPPTALAEDNRLLLALPKAHGKDLFEPPHWRKPAASRATLIELSGDIEAVLQVADSVIDLDPFARRAAPSR
jgi:hypothetical protein